MISTAGHTLLRIIIILIGIDLKAQSFNPNYNFKHLSVQNGLTQNIVYHFLQDSHGNIWIGTHNGLSLYDGIKTTNYLHDERDSTSIARNFISGILEDSAQQIWVSNENGIELYNRADNSFTHLGVDRPDGTKDYTYCVALGFVSANELWFLDTKTRSIRELNAKTKRTSFIAELNTSHALLYKGSGQMIHIWSAYDKGTIHQVYSNKKLIEQKTYFSGKDGSINDPALIVNHVLQQNDTTVWLSTNEGLVKLDPAHNKYHIYNKWKNQTVNEIRYSALSPKGQLWVASGTTGVYSFDTKKNQFIYNLRNNKLDPFSICSDNIVSLYFDRTGNIWCGSYGNGSSYANTENIFFANHLSKDETQAWNSNNNISWLGADENENLWCMLSDVPGFWTLDKEFKIRAHKIPLLENGTNFNGYLNKLLFDKDGNIWCGTNIGLYKYNIFTNKMHPVKYELISEEVQGSIWIKGMIWLNDSSIIFSTYVGLYHVTNVSGNPVVKPVTFLKPGSYIGFETLFQDKSNFIYIKSINDSLYILKPTDNGKNFDLFKSVHLMPDVNYYFNEKNDSLIYIATNYGLYHINNNNFHIEKESCDNKLSFLDIRSIFKKDNKLWIFGEKGLYLFDEKSRQGRTYTVEDGLPSNEFSFSSLVFISDQRCIAGTANGLVSFFPNRLQSLIYPPGVQLTGIYINDILHASTPKSNEIKKINLSFKENTFSFDFSSIAFQHIADCSFEYKLERYDDNWIKSGSAHYTRYSRIPAGNYVFNVRVIDALGRASPFTKTLEINIAKAYWQTNFFKVAVLVFILLIGWLLSRWYFNYKIRKQKREFERQQLIEKERTRIATDMHDDLGAGLSRIKFLSQSILNKKIEDEVIKTELGKITLFSDEMSEKMGEIVWALNEKNDTIADLIAYTRSYSVEYLANHNIQCEANTPLHLPGTFITGEMRRNIFLSVKECLHNIVKHAGATKVWFSVQLNGTIEIVIHDNGKGIDWNNLRAFSNGLQNIDRRMKEINGKVNFSNEKGTRVSLTIPFIL
jgi:signal transduction histidine kinase/ligand-binding sensor domain-containing protein